MSASDGEGIQAAVVYVGQLEDCKYMISILEESGYECVLDVAARLGPTYAVQGYYVVTVPVEDEAAVRAAIEEKLRADLNIPASAEDGEGDEACPACGANLPPGAEECPDCGLQFV